MEQEATILVVDDEARIRRLLRMYLEREGYAVEEAKDGEEALDLSLARDYDLIVLDLMMPKWTEWKCVENYGKKRRRP